MRDDEKKMVEEGYDPSVAEKVLVYIIWLILAAITATVLFLCFHLYLWVFSWAYKLSVHFHYLP